MSNEQQARGETFLPNTPEHESTLIPRRDAIMHIDELLRPSVGADLSRPAPIYRPAPPIPLLDYSVNDHYSVPSGASCELDADGHCVTCSDEALPARVLRVDQESGLAQVSVVGTRFIASPKETIEEIDITLVDSVAPGDILLVHGGVAIAHQGEASHE
jgi:hydrogenase maturation factor